MIGKLYGRVDTVEAESVILMVGGIGFRLIVPASTVARLAIGQKATLHVYTHVRDDAIQLFGFHDRAQQDVFELLLTVTGVGPRLALAILSELTVSQFVHAVRSGAISVLTQVPGVGKKTAERLVLELKDRFKAWETVSSAVGDEGLAGPAGTGIESDVLDALVQLGYSPEESRKAVKAVFSEVPSPSLEEALRAALRRLQTL